MPVLQVFTPWRQQGAWCMQWLLVLALLWPTLAPARDHITERAWLEDASGQWGLEDVRAQNFTPYEGLLSRGYGLSAIWIRLRIDPAT
ncbi:MAG: hypothetical protein K2Y10_10550, partial [Burkholderiaceae bacterium]|nr:hypothetical protein [Burkholderiaceae bacterium]